MSPRDRERHYRKRRALRAADLKDRLIQTRVPESLESALKDEARKRRLSVSHLIRNVLEDTFHLVDNVVSEVDNIVHDSVGLARQVRRDAERIALGARAASERGPQARGAEADDEAKAAAPQPTAAAPVPVPEKAKTAATPAKARAAGAGALEQVIAWNKVVLNTDALCASCGKALAKGSEAHLGLSQVPGPTPTWLCPQCLAEL